MTKFLAIAALAASTLAGAHAAHAAGTYYATTVASTPLGTAGNTPTTLLSITVPKGAWVITGKATPVNFGGGTFVRCGLMDSGVLDFAASDLGEASNKPAVATIFTRAVKTTTGTGTFNLVCQHDSTASGLYVDPQASLLVERAAGNTIAQ